jgi:hypothetical protein
MGQERARARGSSGGKGEQAGGGRMMAMEGCQAVVGPETAAVDEGEQAAQRVR